MGPATSGNAASRGEAPASQAARTSLAGKGRRPLLRPLGRGQARILGSRAVKQPALEKLKQTIRSFAEWRSLQRGPDAEQQSLSDRALVASAPERIKNLEAEATRLDARAEEAEREVAHQEREVEETAEGIADLRPALRGSRGDFRLVLASNVVVFGVDFYIIQVALETIPGTFDQRRLTAAMLGAGAV